MTVNAALTQAIAALREAGIEGAATDARRLMAAALGADGSRLSLVGPDTLEPDQSALLQAYVTARLSRQPVAQIIGKRAFYGRDFKVTADVLDPRPETETLVDIALSAPFETVLDVGTGSGCILVTLLAEVPNARGEGVDLSARALDVAQENARWHAVAERAVFYRSDYLGAVTGPYDLIVSNPPYIAAREMADLSPEVREWEPHLALTPGTDGLAAYRVLAAQAAQFLNETGRIVVEIGYAQGADVCALFKQAMWDRVTLHADLNGHDRVVSAVKSASQLL
nr:peptide chain release factor N(5)-glutamine methyltransferase [Nereida sp. MMG025]